MVTDAWQLKDWFCGHEEILLEREERKRKSERGRERGGGGERRERRKERGKEGWLDGREPLLASSLTAPLGSLARCERYSGFVPREDSHQNPG